MTPPAAAAAKKAQVAAPAQKPASPPPSQSAGALAGLQFPPIPTKNCFVIGEAAALALTKAHVIRYWEKRVPQLAASARRRNGRRFYSTEDIFLLRRISSLIAAGHSVGGVGAALAEKSPTSAQNAFVRTELRRIIDIL